MEGKVTKQREIDRLRSKVDIIHGHAIYAYGHLDRYHGYNDSNAILYAKETIHELIDNLSGTQLEKHIDKEILKLWEDNLNSARYNDAYTSAIARNLMTICEELLDIIDEIERGD